MKNMQKYYKSKGTLIALAALICLVLLAGWFWMRTAIGGESAETDKMKSSAQKHYQYKTAFVGDNSKVVNLIRTLDYQEYLDKVALQTKAEPYGIVANYKLDDPKAKIDQLEIRLFNNAAVMFSLIENVDIIIFNVDKGGILDKYSFARSEFDRRYGGKIWDLSKDIETFEGFLESLELKGEVESN